MSDAKEMASRPKLSILIATIVSRKRQYDKLASHLTRQIQENGGAESVELLSLCDDKSMVLGDKRNRLLELAKGEYIVFIDDDDWVPDYYVKNILENLGHDAVSILIECTFDDRNKCLAKASMKYDWAENIDGYRYVRSIYHKTPVRRELALQAKFPSLRFGEDHEYSKRLKPLVKSESVITQVMYHYNYRTENHKFKYGFTHDVK